MMNCFNRFCEPEARQSSTRPCDPSLSERECGGVAPHRGSELWCISVLNYRKKGSDDQQSEDRVDTRVRGRTNQSLASRTGYVIKGGTEREKEVGSASRWGARARERKYEVYEKNGDNMYESEGWCRMYSRARKKSERSTINRELCEMRIEERTQSERNRETTRV